MGFYASAKCPNTDKVSLWVFKNTNDGIWTSDSWKEGWSSTESLSVTVVARFSEPHVTRTVPLHVPIR